MKRILAVSLALLMWIGLPLGVQAGQRPTSATASMKATATAHGITYSWTASASSYAGLGYNLYVGTTPGGESSTPANSALMAPGCSGATCTYTYTNVVSQATYYAVLATCVPTGSGGSGETCSAKTPEVAATIPLAAGDIATPTGFSGSPF